MHCLVLVAKLSWHEQFHAVLSLEFGEGEWTRYWGGQNWQRSSRSPLQAPEPQILPAFSLSLWETQQHSYSGILACTQWLCLSSCASPSALLAHSATSNRGNSELIKKCRVKLYKVCTYMIWLNWVKYHISGIIYTWRAQPMYFRLLTCWFTSRSALQDWNPQDMLNVSIYIKEKNLLQHQN